jgi:hypothetical protein
MGWDTMKRKKDMYIRYNRSYKSHRRKGIYKLWITVISVLLFIGIAAVAFFAIKAWILEKDRNSELDGQKPGTEVESPSIAVAHLENNVDKLTPAMTPTPTFAPTLTPTPTPQLKELSQDNRTPVKVKGIYVTANVAGMSLLDRLVDLAETTEINTMVIDVKDDHGRITYAIDSAKAKEIGAVKITISDMEELIKSLKEKKIYLIARIVAFKDPYLAEQREELAIKNKDGSLFRDSNGEGWVNPYNKEVWEYLIEIASQAAVIGFDEIQFDYIRFSTGRGIQDVDFGVTEVEKTKEEIIVEFTKYAYEKIKPLGVFVSADVYGTIINSSVDATLVGQNYVEMSKYLDYICPMIYPSHFGEGNYGIQNPDLEPYNIIFKALSASKTKLDQIPEGEHRAIIRPWLQDFTATWNKEHMTYGGLEVREQIKAVYDVGYEEWLLWNAGCKYSEEGLLPEEMQ